jgi:hypothetical protein
MNITAGVLIDLRGLPERRQRYELGALSTAPDGARVLLLVGDTAAGLPGVWVAAEHLDRLRVEVFGTPEVVRDWIAYLRGELPDATSSSWSPRRYDWSTGGAA